MGFNPLSIIGWLTGLPLGQISSDIRSVKIAQISADGDTKKQALQNQQKEMELQRDTYLAMAASRIATGFVVFLSLPAALYIWQLIVYDKMVAPWFGGHATDDLSSNLWWYVMAVLTYWLGKRLIAEAKK